MIKKEIINQSIDYILEHFEEELFVEDVAAHFHFSKFYFCRSFKAATGESVYEFIKRLKMDQSAIAIKLEKDRAITEIGLDYGYSSSNYSSAFRKHHRVSPTAFRRSVEVKGMTNPFYPEGVSGFQSFADYARHMRIEELPDYRVIYERMIGNYGELKDKWFAFLETYRAYQKEDTLLLERFFDDPAVSDRDSCLCDLCMTTDADCPLEKVTTIKGGRFAMYRFEGRICDIFATLQGITNVWIPESGYKMAGHYGLNLYREIDRENERVVMDLCIPIK